MNISLTLAQRIEIWLMLRHDCLKSRCVRHGLGACFQCESELAIYHYALHISGKEILYYAGSCGGCIEKAL